MREILNDFISKEKFFTIEDLENYRNDSLSGILINIVRINETLKELKISKESQKEINDFLKDFKPFITNSIEYFQKNLNNLEILLKDLERFIAKWDDRVFLELKKIPIIIPFLEGNLNTNKLLSGVEEFFTIKPNTWRNLPTIQKDDLQDFIRCYLNQAWTPAGIMAMRVIESAVRDYYSEITSKESTNWNEILIDLKKNHPDANQDLIKRLDYIRKNVRNPLAHPELRLNFQEAEECFQQALYVLYLIYK